MRSTEFTTEELGVIVDALDNLSAIREDAADLLDELQAELEERLEMESMEAQDAD
mgnify:CR=1 FL=1